MLKGLEAAIGIEPMNKGFADLCLTTWLRRPKERQKVKGKRQKFRFPLFLLPFSFCHEIWSGRRDLNSRPSPWQGDALPLSYSRFPKRVSILMIKDGLSRQRSLPSTGSFSPWHAHLARDSRAGRPCHSFKLNLYSLADVVSLSAHGSLLMGARAPSPASTRRRE